MDGIDRESDSASELQAWSPMLPRLLTVGLDPAERRTIERSVRTSRPLAHVHTPLEAIDYLGEIGAATVLAAEHLTSVGGAAFLRFVAEMYPGTECLLARSVIQPRAAALVA